MFQIQGSKTMLDLHGLTVKEVKKLLEDYFTRIEQLNLGEIYIITGRGNHVNSDGSSGVLKKILPKLLKPYCQAIHQINQETGAYKIILKPRQDLSGLKDSLTKLLADEREQIHYATFLKQQAEKNNIEAILALATIHLHQAIKGFDNINEGIALLLKAKQLSSLEADVQLGILYHEGLIVKQQHEKAFKHFYHAANKEHPVAQYYVAVCYLHGKGVRYNDEQAVNWMKKSADQGNVYAQTTLSDFYLLGKITQSNSELAIHYKTKAAEQGLADAQIDLARCYATGYGVKQDYQTAFKWYLSAAQSNKANAMYLVGIYLLEGRSGYPPNANEAFGWFLKAAELGDADGQAQVAFYYLYGEAGVKQDTEKGLAWAAKAVEKKNQYGYYVMAIAYLDGVGVEQDAIKAHSFMKLAAEAGYSIAQYQLGLLLIGKGPSAPGNFEAGIQWLEKAAAQNHVEAIQALNHLFPKADTTSSTTVSLPGSALSDYYELGELAYLLLNPWYMMSEEHQNFVSKEYSLLYDEFVKRVDHLAVEHPKKMVEEKLTDHIINYIEIILQKLGEKSLFAIYFNVGFKIMAVKLMEFTNDEINIVKELLEYLQLVNIDINIINKIEIALNKQLTNPSKEPAAEFELLEAELKNYLSSMNQIENTNEMSYSESNNNCPIINTAPQPEVQPNDVNRYSMWYKGAAIGLAAAAVGLAATNPAKVEKGIKTICSIQ